MMLSNTRLALVLALQVAGLDLATAQATWGIGLVDGVPCNPPQAGGSANALEDPVIMELTALTTPNDAPTTFDLILDWEEVVINQSIVLAPQESARFEHTYSNPGIYTVEWTVTAGGRTATTPPETGNPLRIMSDGSCVAGDTEAPSSSPSMSAPTETTSPPVSSPTEAPSESDDGSSAAYKKLGFGILAILGLTAVL